MNLSDESTVYYAFNVSQPDVVIHCAGNADVDWCQKNPREAEYINVRGTGHVCDAAAECGSRVVYLSTNAVFNGVNPPYRESDKCTPINHYGAVKHRAEWAVRQYEHRWTIVRPILLYGWNYPWGRQNWATRVLAAKRARKNLRIVADTMTQPTYAGWCAETIWRLIDGEHDGIFHVGGADKMSLWQFCAECAAVWSTEGSTLSLAKASSADFPTIAPRPADTTYDLSKIKALGIEPITAATGLNLMKEQFRWGIR